MIVGTQTQGFSTLALAKFLNLSVAQFFISHTGLIAMPTSVVVLRIYMCGFPWWRSG